MNVQRTTGFLLMALMPLVVSGAFRAHSQGAAEPKNPAAQKSEPPKDGKVFKIKDADYFEQKKIAGRDIFILTGHVEIEIPEDNLFLFTDRAELDKETRTARAMGNVKLARGDEMTLRSDALTVNVDDNRAICTNNVRLIYKSKPKPSEQPSPPGVSKSNGKAEVKTITLTCGRLEYDLDKKTATATGKLNIDYDEGSATAEKAILMEEDKLVTLEGKVNVTNKGEDRITFSLEKLKVNIETGELSGDKPKGNIPFRKKNQPEEKPKAEQDGKKSQ